MTKLILRGAMALPLLLCAAPIFAHDGEDHTIAKPDGHAPANVMADHVHKQGDVMFGLIWTHERSAGANYSGTNKASDADLIAQGYAVRAKSMEMDMVMGHVMWAPSNRITLVVMPMWMRMKMTMLGLTAPVMHEMPEMPTMDSEPAAHHMLMPGETMSHSVSGIGDTKAGALISLSRDPALSAHAGLMVSIPTGSVSKKNADGTFVHYGMQPGSGTWDLEPSLTVKGASSTLSWGVQASYLARLESRNDSGYSLGDRFAATAWVARPLSKRLSVSARLAYSDEGDIKGHYNGPHRHASPPDRQANYGGQLVEAGLGANLVIGQGLRIGAEAMVPLYQDLNGFQLRKDWGGGINISHAF